MLYKEFKKLRIGLVGVLCSVAIFVVAIILLFIFMDGNKTIFNISLAVAILALIANYIFYFIIVKKSRLRVLSIFNKELAVKKDFSKDDRKPIELIKIKSMSTFVLKCKTSNGKIVKIPDYVVERYGDSMNAEGVMHSVPDTKIYIRPFISVKTGDVVKIKAYFKLDCEIFALVEVVQDEETKKKEPQFGMISYNSLI